MLFRLFSDSSEFLRFIWHTTLEVLIKPTYVFLIRFWRMFYRFFIASKAYWEKKPFKLILQSQSQIDIFV